MNTKYTWWTKPNLEGVSNKDVLQVMIFGICLFASLIVIWIYIKN